MKNHTIVFVDRSGSMQGLLKEANLLADNFLHMPGRVELWDGVEPWGRAAQSLRPDEAWGPFPTQKFDEATQYIRRSPARTRRIVFITDEPEIGFPPSAWKVIEQLRAEDVLVHVLKVSVT